MRTKTLKEAINNLAEEAAELAAASSRYVNRTAGKGILLEDVFKQKRHVDAVMSEIAEHVHG